MTPLFCTFKRTYPVYSRWFPSFVVVDNETWESISKKWMLLKRPSWNELQTLSMALTYHYRAHCGLLAQLHIGYRSSLFAYTFRFDSQIRPQIPVIDGKLQRRTSPARRSEKHSVWWFSANWHSPQNGLVRPPHSITWSHSLRVAWELVVGYIINRVPLWRIMSLSKSKTPRQAM